MTGLSKPHLHEYQAGEAVGYVVDCKDGIFEVHKWCLYNSEFLLTMHKGMFEIYQRYLVVSKLYRQKKDFESIKARKNFKGKGRKTFNLKEFRKAPIRMVYDSLHGISTVGMYGSFKGARTMKYMVLY